MADNVYNLKFTLSNGDVIDAGQITAPQGPKGDKGDSADIPYSSSTPFMDGVGSVGSANTVARGDHRHPSDTSRQEKLVSGTNIKTINGQSVLGSGDIQSYPIGSIYQSTSATSPSSLFGGTWTALPNAGTNETASLVMTEQAISSSSFSFESGAGTVVADEFFVVHNADYSIMQIIGRLKVTPSRTSGGIVGVKFNIGSNIIKKTSQRRQCGFYYDGSGGHESVWIQIKTSGDIVIYNNSTYKNLPTTEAAWSVNAIFFNKSSDGETLYRWKRIS